MSAPPPKIESLHFSRYRCFRDPQSARLSRLSLIYGENNSGKSALIRLPALLADSRMPGQAGLDPASATLPIASPRQVQWRGALPPEEDPDVELGLTLGDGWRWRWVLEWRDAVRNLSVRTVELVDPTGSPVELSRRGGLNGLVPPTGGSESTDDAIGLLHSLMNRVRWLGAWRVGPSQTGVPVGSGGRVWGDGQHAEAVALADRKLLARVSEFYSAAVRQRVAPESLGPDSERLVLTPSVGASHSAAFSESGSGLQRMFPVVVALELLREQGGLLVVEEPEAHLHPRLQRVLAEYIVDVLASQPGAQVLLETHSEIFLLAALAAAVPHSGLGPDPVVLHWVDHDNDGSAKVEPIRLHTDGRPETPRLERAFETMGVMRREVIAKRRDHAR